MKKKLKPILILALFAVIIPVELFGQTDEAVPVEYSIRTKLPRRILLVAPRNEYYVATTGDDANPGTMEKPFRTIQKCADIMEPGDVCLVREGTYRETVRPKKSGTRRYHMQFIAYPGEKVTLSGTEPLKGKWEHYKGSIYKTKVDQNFEQLFLNGEMMIEARWPNMRMDELWDRSRWATSGRGSGYGRMVDPELAKTDVNWTGAVATLNVNPQFYTFSRKVTRHSKGSDSFEYDRDMFSEPSPPTTPIKPNGGYEDDYYYLTGKLGALDMPSEWFLDTQTQTLYLWAPDGKNPADHNVEVKVRDYAFEAVNVDQIRLIGFYFFGATFRFENTTHSEVDDCHLLYPTFGRELPESQHKPTPSPCTIMTGSYNTIRNSTLGFTPYAGIQMIGQYNVLDNNLVHDVCWSGSLKYPAISMTIGEERDDAGYPSLIRVNTVHNAGSAAIGFRLQAYIIEYNHVYDAGLMSRDVAAIYTGGSRIDGSIVRYNWVHDIHPELENGKNIGLGIRGDDQSRNMTVNHNVVWNSGKDNIVLKGEYNKVYNNTTFHLRPELKKGNNIRMDTEPEPYKAWRVDYPLLSEQNAHSLVFNNITGLIRAYHGNQTPYVHSSNVSHNCLDYAPELRDPENYDFRPKEGSKLIDGGKVMPGLTDHFEGDAPDIGAYEYGGVFWKPGYVPKEALFYKNFERRNDIPRRGF